MFQVVASALREAVTEGAVVEIATLEDEVSPTCVKLKFPVIPRPAKVFPLVLVWCEALSELLAPNSFPWIRIE